MEKITGFSMRRAGPGDLDQIVEIEKAWPTTPHWSKAQFEQELKLPEAQLYVGVLGGKILGYFSLRIYPPEGQVLNVAVRPDIVGRGVGLELMEVLHRIAHNAKCMFMTLEVGATNKPAVSLYRKLGYQIVGRRSKYYNDNIDAFLMTKYLTISEY